jgi:hypothetical protein
MPEDGILHRLETFQSKVLRLLERGCNVRSVVLKAKNIKITIFCDLQGNLP